MGPEARLDEMAGSGVGESLKCETCSAYFPPCQSLAATRGMNSALHPGSELNQVVNPIGPVNQRAREFGAEKRSEVGRAALARNGQRILTVGRLVASRCVAGGKDETPGAETLGVWC